MKAVRLTVSKTKQRRTSYLVCQSGWNFATVTFTHTGLKTGTNTHKKPITKTPIENGTFEVLNGVSKSIFKVKKLVSILEHFWPGV